MAPFLNKNHTRWGSSFTIAWWRGDSPKNLHFKALLHSEKTLWKNYILGKFMKNGAILVFTACSESLSLQRKSFWSWQFPKSVYYNENLKVVNIHPWINKSCGFLSKFFGSFHKSMKNGKFLKIFASIYNFYWFRDEFSLRSCFRSNTQISKITNLFLEFFNFFPFFSVFSNF